MLKRTSEIRPEFQIYRPPLPTGRLDPVYDQRSKSWKPSLAYKYTLNDVRNQLTPSEHYRHRLVTSGPLIRQLQRLEWRWQRNFEEFTRAAIRVQSLHRGIKNRENFLKVKDALMIHFKQREGKKEALRLYNNGNFDESIAVINKVPLVNMELLEMRMRSESRSSKREKCEATARQIIEMDERFEDAYYFLAASLAARGKFLEAYLELQNLFANVDSPHEASYRLKGLVCMKVDPPKYVEAVETFDALIKEHPEDMNAYLQRACLLSILQDWDRALEDANLILYYQPGLMQVVNLRARIRACRREWVEAKADYQYVAYYSPGDTTAEEGLADLSQPSGILPMVNIDVSNEC